MTDASRLAAGLDECPSRSGDVVVQRVRDEAVLVPVVQRGADVGSVYGLNEVGVTIWERLDGRTRGRDIVDAIVDD